MLVGTGGRGIGMYARPIVKDYSDVAELTGLCDVNPRRMEVARSWIGRDIPSFTDFDEMLDKVPCDVVIVTSKDSTHHEYIIKALRRGKDVITEKPMTIDAEKCRAILAAERESKGHITVTFNYRFTPYTTRIKELLREGIVGDIYSVEFHWFLDTLHGADYYRRWHRRKENSGGLLVHKATHHFDIVNWWLEAEPKLVYARGKRRVYGSAGKFRGERCRTCSYTQECPFYFDLTSDERAKELYISAEHVDGYYRDSCVFAEEIDIEDTMALVVEYKNGIQMSYTLSSYMPFEGWRMAINGSKGRLELSVADAFYPTEAVNLKERASIRKSIDPFKAALGDMSPETSDLIRFYPTFGGVKTFEVKRALGGHGGGDERLRDMLFREGIPDPLGYMAGSWAGAMSILIGIAANESIATGRPVIIEDLLKGFPEG